MQKARRGLGRGLSALIPDADMDFLTRVARGDNNFGDDSDDNLSHPRSKSSELLPSDDQTAPRKTRGTMKTDAKQSKILPQTPPTPLAQLVLLSQIEANPYQPRHTFSEEEMQELSDSVKQHGVLQPILLRPLATPSTSAPQSSSEIKYQLVAGERRWRASQKAGLNEIPAIIRRISDQQALELAVIENVQRHDISALDAASAYRRLSQEFSLSQEEIAQRVGKSRAAIANTMRLLDLPIEVQNAIADGSLTEGHGRAILLAGSDGARRAVFRRVVREKLSVRATEELARVIQQESSNSHNKESSDDPPVGSRHIDHAPPEIRRIEEGLQKRLGTRVRIRPRKNGGQVLIQYFSNEELERLLKLMLH